MLMKDMVEWIEEKEQALAPGSETSVLQEFVNKYDYLETLVEECPGKEVSYGEFFYWFNRYESYKLEQVLDERNRK